MQAGEVIASVGEKPICAPFSDELRGLIYDSLPFATNEKVGDLDPGGLREACFSVSDKSLAAGGGAVEAALTRLQTSKG